MGTTDLAPTYVDELLRRQDALQAEVSRVIGELDLMRLLGRAGLAEQVGSSVSGLMVWRDIDFSVLSPGVNAERSWIFMRPIVSHPRITRLTYRNETGDLNRSGRAFDDRYYFVIHYQTMAGDNWKIDVSLWVDDAPRRQRAQALALASLAREKRVRILWLKDVWHRLPTYPDQVGGTDIYDAVLEHNVSTPEEFDSYLVERGMPARAGQVPRT
jgi:hypothetical protein